MLCVKNVVSFPLRNPRWELHECHEYVESSGHLLAQYRLTAALTSVQQGGGGGGREGGREGKRWQERERDGRGGRGEEGEG